MLVICGGQRSGTSALAKMFKVQGYDIGASWWDDEVDGGLENPVLCSFYSDYIGDTSFPFEGMVKAEKHRATDFCEVELPVTKFSYLTMVPAFIPIWKKFRPTWMGDSFIVMQRNVEDILRSKARHEEIFEKDSTLLMQSSTEFKINKFKSVSMLLGYNYPVAYQRFDTLNSAECLNYTLKILGSKLRLDQDVVSKVYDESKVHF